ncbi:hypothetical protein [Roseovarius pelagicus]|uniref:Uncharacterized protein n=1 Tax=Roseovarius pelagicus TaxID=2980108 RepID=A0ABY6DFC2_9RHOB|nr:hypothetical protein [Roseovarius pelagicus]UXX84851.1 hypothetical protein N7U68_09515 [Roseovarius pelagicus]
MSLLKMFSFLVFVMQIALLSFNTLPLAAQGALTVTDRGEDIVFPMGEVSFADSVVSFEIGRPSSEPQYADPKAALGHPDGKDTNALTLGCGGVVVLSFDDNFLVNVEGPDLYVFEVGDDVEATDVSISENGETWHELGRISGATAAIDIARYVPKGEARFRLVKLTDARARCNSRWPGADIDAVAAIGAIVRDETGVVNPAAEQPEGQTPTVTAEAPEKNSDTLPEQKTDAENAGSGDIIASGQGQPAETAKAETVKAETAQKEDEPAEPICGETSSLKKVSDCLAAVKKHAKDNQDDTFDVYWRALDKQSKAYKSRRTVAVPGCYELTNDLLKLMTYIEREHKMAFGTKPSHCAGTFRVLQPFGFENPSLKECENSYTQKGATACVLALLKTSRAPVIRSTLQADQKRCRNPYASPDGLRGGLEKLAVFEMPGSKEKERKALYALYYKNMTCELLDQVLLAAGMKQEQSSAANQTETPEQNSISRNSSELVFDSPALKIYAPKKMCNQAKLQYSIVADALLSKHIIESLQFRVGPISAAYTNKMEDCLVGDLRPSGVTAKLLADKVFNPTVAFYITGSGRKYASGKFEAKGFKVTSNISLLSQAPALPEVEGQESKIAKVIDQINETAKRQQVLTSAAEHIHTQVSNLLKDQCAPNTPFTASGFIPRWENGKCAMRTADNGSFFGNTYMYGWSVETSIDSCADDLSSCKYSFQFVCNAYERGGGWTELCRIPRNQRGFPVQHGTLKLK